MNWYNVGKIVNTHGIRGEVRVISSTDFPEERFAVGSKLGLFKKTDKKPLPLIVASHRKHKNFDLLTFEGFSTIEMVEGFRDGILKVSENQLEELEDNAFYFHEIIGCKVIDLDGNDIGEVQEILQTGANDVWAIKNSAGKMHYIPYIEDVVKEVNIEEQVIKIDALDGLL
ncbi:ribosome maturation factor RimM [Paenisporosarcina cavernae]|uniref:Ribosome maturation factor RimM n=1 Tax=Paenisporosarcina cavernae TaxID=2320858 RepID=A0A385YS66_9BACL|nr:ribosome maturation factor RimM [Paenisporosarcina cavernae]AYC29220.1 ribosome maturation factor RimM [Paenisporosarcina cavernae]